MTFVITVKPKGTDIVVFVSDSILQREQQQMVEHLRAVKR